MRVLQAVKYKGYNQEFKVDRLIRAAYAFKSDWWGTEITRWTSLRRLRAKIFLLDDIAEVKCAPHAFWLLSNVADGSRSKQLVQEDAPVGMCDSNCLSISGLFQVISHTVRTLKFCLVSNLHRKKNSLLLCTHNPESSKKKTHLIWGQTLNPFQVLLC
jgi:hypothetical protein